MHARKKGKSGSTRPSKKVLHNWIRYKPKEVELLITKLSKEGKTSSQIGLHLRDTYGIPSVTLITKKKISKILAQKGLSPKIPENLKSLIKKAIEIRKHMERNKKDLVSKRGLTLTESKIRRLIKYYKRNEVLPQDWKYDPSTASLLLE